MHYPAAERSLLLLNSNLMQGIVKHNMAAAYHLIVKGLQRHQQNPHWNQSVTTITFSVTRTYMEMNRHQYD
jgi:hypothetical protein